MGKKRTEKEWEEHRFPLERSFQEYVIKRLKQYPQISVDNISQKFTRGFSDLLVLVRPEGSKYPIPCFIELKVGSNKPTKLQERFLERKQAIGAITGVAYTWGEVKRIIERTGFKFE